MSASRLLCWGLMQTTELCACRSSCVFDLCVHEVVGSVEIQRDAAAMMAESERPSRVVSSLAGLGSFGRLPGNCERDLQRLVAREGGLLLQPTEVLVDLWCVDSMQVLQCPVPLLLPHEFFSVIHRNPSRWVDLMGSSQSCTSFWRAVIQGTPAFSDHPLLGNPDQHFKVIPLRIHGDGAEFSRRSAMVCMTWGSALARSGSPWDSRLLLFCIPKDRMTPNTLAQILRPVAWSLAVMIDGTWPSEDWQGRPWPVGSRQHLLAGQPLAGGHCAAVCDVVGDWAWICELFSAPTWASHNMCWQCDATLQGDLEFSNFRSTAPWRLTAHTTAQLIGWQPPGRMCPLLLLPNFGIHVLRWDFMHSVNLGMAPTALASAILSLCQRGAFGPGALPRKLSLAFSEFRQWCRLHHQRCRCKAFSKATLGVSKNDYPALSCKAHAARVLTAWVATVAVAHAQESPHATTVAVCLHSLAGMFSLLEANGRFLREPVAEKFHELGHTFLLAYATLAQESLQNQELRWPLRPKLHALTHILQWTRATHRSCKYVSVFLDEDLVGKLVATARACARPTVAWGVLQRYLVRMTRRWKGLDRPAKRVTVVRNFLRLERLVPPPLRP